MLISVFVNPIFCVFELWQLVLVCPTIECYNNQSTKWPTNWLSKKVSIRSQCICSLSVLYSLLFGYIQRHLFYSYIFYILGNWIGQLEKEVSLSWSFFSGLVDFSRNSRILVLLIQICNIKRSITASFSNAEVGLGLIGFGFFFTFLGVILFFDRGLLALGNVSLFHSLILLSVFIRILLFPTFLTLVLPYSLSPLLFSFIKNISCQIFWLTGVALLLGWRSTWNLFTSRANYKVWEITNQDSCQILNWCYIWPSFEDARRTEWQDEKIVARLANCKCRSCRFAVVNESRNLVWDLFRSF